MSTSQKQNRWLGFSLQDITTLAVLSALTFVGMALGGPLHALRIFGIQTLLTGPVIAFFLMFALIKLEKPGTAILMAAISSVLTVAIHPSAFVYSLFAAIVAELITLAFFRSYHSRSSKYCVCILRVLLQLPAQVLYTFLVIGTPVSEYVRFSTLVAVVFVAAIVLSCAAAFAAEKIARELIRSGRLK